MLCVQCQREIADEVNYCPSCGSAQRASNPSSGPRRRLTRSPVNAKIGGVCAGLAQYFDLDVTLVRFLWVILSIVPGAILGGVLAYIVAWFLMPEPVGPTPRIRSRLTRSIEDRKIAGVCGGLGEFLQIDSTLIRLVWAVLTILPGAIVGGVLAYLVAWFIIPAPEPVPAANAALTATG